MVRPGAPTPAKRKDKEGPPASAEDRAEEAESKRLRDLAFSRGLFSRTKSHAQNPSTPSSTIMKSDGRDIVKKGHRKSKYLFAFPGLMSPVAGGKIGELTNLDSKNPILYVEFPEGRLKLFGTIVYPKNKYLTLHFPRGSGNILCEDCFESLIVFSSAWWIGTKEHNPEEARLPLPKNFEQIKHADFDFTAGAGEGKETKKSKGKSEFDTPHLLQTKLEASRSESNDDDLLIHSTSQPVRQSARTTGKTLKYADSSSENEDTNETETSEESQQILSSKGNKKLETPNHLGGKSLDSHDEVKTVTSVDVKAVGAEIKTPASNKRLVLKQSRLDAFQLKSALQEEGNCSVDVVTPVAKPKETSSLPKSAPRSVKRSRKTLKDDDTEKSSGHDLLIMKETPKGRKRAKDEDVKGVKKASTEGTPTNSTLKVKQDKRTQTTSASKQKAPSARKSSATKSSKKQKFDSDEASDSSDEPSDDSDEDWAE